MNKIKLDNWYLDDNKLSISLMRFYTEINILSNDEFIYYQTKVIDNNSNQLIFSFYSIEDAISFVESVIKNSKTTDEILEIYKKIYESNKFKSKMKTICKSM